MKKANIPEIIVKVEDGCVQDVQMPKNGKVRLRVMDFDICDTDHPSVKFDTSGRPYAETVWMR